MNHLFEKNPNLRSTLVGVLTGTVYGIVARFLYGTHASQWLIMHIGNPARQVIYSVMTVSFLVLVPLALGFLTVYWASQDDLPGLAYSFFMPWVSMAVSLAASWLIGWEGAICIIMASPICFVLASVGGVLSHLLIKKGYMRREMMFTMFFLPYLVAPLEGRIPLSDQLRTVRNTIEIKAPASRVWREIRSVRKIQPEEHHFSWTHWIGFPRPIEATLSGSGVGGVRYATFDGGVLFVETITSWQENQDLAFRIKADTQSIPPTTLDEHVRVGGEYFDVLDGHYQIEPLEGGRVRLHLSSDHRLSTPLKSYSGLWTDFVMSDIQSYILRIIKTRCETR